MYTLQGKKRKTFERCDDDDDDDDCSLQECEKKLSRTNEEDQSEAEGEKHLSTKVRQV